MRKQNVTKLLLPVTAFCFSTAHAASAVPVLFPPGHQPVAMNEPLQVAIDVIQFDLGEGRIVSAARGAELQFQHGSVGIEAHVANGTVTLVDLPGNQVIPLNPGTTHTLESLAAAHADDAERGLPMPPALPTYRLPDAVLVKQQHYIKSLRIDVRDLNRGLASIIRAFTGASR